MDIFMMFTDSPLFWLLLLSAFLLFSINICMPGLSNIEIILVLLSLRPVLKSEGKTPQDNL